MPTSRCGNCAKILVPAEAAAVTYVIDTSVLVRWFLGQSGYETARRYRDEFLAGSIELRTVECARFELPWVLRKHGLLRGEMTRDEYLAGARIIDDLDITVAAIDADAVEACVALPHHRNIGFFEAVFVYLALRSRWMLLTADERQARAAEAVGVEVALVKA